MLIRLNRFYSTEEIITEYRIPRELADKIAPHLPVFLTREDGTKIHLESEVDEFLKAFMGRVRNQEKTVDVKLTDRESDIIEAIGDKTLTGERVAKSAGYKFDGHFKGILSSMVKREIIENCHPGYRLRKS